MCLTFLLVIKMQHKAIFQEKWKQQSLEDSLFQTAAKLGFLSVEPSVGHF